MNKIIRGLKIASRKSAILTLLTILSGSLVGQNGWSQQPGALGQPTTQRSVATESDASSTDERSQNQNKRGEESRSSRNFADVNDWELQDKYLSPLSQAIILHLQNNLGRGVGQRSVCEVRAGDPLPRLLAEREGEETASESPFIIDPEDIREEIAEINASQDQTQLASAQGQGETRRATSSFRTQSMDEVARAWAQELISSNSIKPYHQDSTSDTGGFFFGKDWLELIRDHENAIEAIRGGEKVRHLRTTYVPYYEGFIPPTQQRYSRLLFALETTFELDDQHTPASIWRLRGCRIYVALDDAGSGPSLQEPPLVAEERGSSQNNVQAGGQAIAPGTIVSPTGIVTSPGGPGFGGDTGAPRPSAYQNGGGQPALISGQGIANQFQQELTNSVNGAIRDTVTGAVGSITGAVGINSGGTSSNPGQQPGVLPQQTGQPIYNQGQVYSSPTGVSAYQAGQPGAVVGGNQVGQPQQVGNTSAYENNPGGGANQGIIDLSPQVNETVSGTQQQSQGWVNGFFDLINFWD